MLSVDTIELEKVIYVQEMKDYLEKLKKMNRNKAKKKSFNNLVKSQIINKNGKFTEHYQHNITLSDKE